MLPHLGRPGRLPPPLLEPSYPFLLSVAAYLSRSGDGPATEGGGAFGGPCIRGCGLLAVVPWATDSAYNGGRPSSLANGEGRHPLVMLVAQSARSREDLARPDIDRSLQIRSSSLPVGDTPP